MKEEWLFPEAVVPVDAETTAALVAEIHRLIDVVGGMALKEPALQDIEQYRLQMAGICTAAIGYWKESDSIHPDYDTLALRDVAKLYAKYDELYKAQDVSHGMIAGALFDLHRQQWMQSKILQKCAACRLMMRKYKIGKKPWHSQSRRKTLEMPNLQHMDNCQRHAKQRLIYTTPPRVRQRP